MLTLVREKFPNTSLTDKDIYNRRYEIEKVEREGYYDIASLVQRIRKWCVDEEGGDYELFWLDNDKTGPWRRPLGIPMAVADVEAPLRMRLSRRYIWSNP